MPRIDEHPLSQAPSQQINIIFNFITAQETLPCPLLVWSLAPARYFTPIYGAAGAACRGGIPLTAYLPGPLPADKMVTTLLLYVVYNP